MEEYNQAVDADTKNIKLASDNNELTPVNNLNTDQIEDSPIETSKKKKKPGKIRNEINIKAKPKFTGNNSN